MKPCSKFLLTALIAGFELILGGQMTAQTLTTLHSFTILSNNTNCDGAGPNAVLVFSDNILYGTANFGGSSGNGAVFRLNTDGTGFTNLHSFTTNSDPLYTNSDGALPYAGVTLSGKILYGTAEAGGSSGNGTVFAVNTDGTGFTNLHSFAGASDGANPYAGLVLSNNTLYGTAFAGGTSGYGTVFAVKIDGTGFTNLHNFAYEEGTGPVGGLILLGNTLYGTTYNGGSPSAGTVFGVNTDGTGFTNLHIFTGDGGSNPYAGLILSGGTLCGTARFGSSSAPGMVFTLNTDGTGFTNLHNFTGSDGAYPYAGLVLSDNTLYGTAWRGGSSDAGTVFGVNTDGTGFTNLHSFLGYPGEGAEPKAGLILSGSTLYGTASYGGSSLSGTVFSLSLVSVSPPHLTIIPSGQYVILTWPTNATGFALQSTTNLVSPAIWTTNSPEPVVVNGQNTVTNPISGERRFYRLSQ